MKDRPLIVEYPYDGRFVPCCDYCGPWTEVEIAQEDGEVLVHEFHAADCPYALWHNSDDPHEPPPWDLDGILIAAEELVWKAESQR